MLLDKKRMKEALAILSRDAKVLVPMEVDGVAKFTPWDGQKLPSLDMINTTLPPKDALFPQTEKMYNFTTGPNAQIAEVQGTEKQVLFGVRSCDARSIDCMDKAFLTGTFGDSFYSKKRENLTIIAVGCVKTGPFCFCDSMGLDPSSAPNADVQLADLGDAYAVTAQTERGTAVLDQWKSLLTEGEGDAPKPKCVLQVSVPEDFPKKLMGMFEHPIWDEVSKPCLGCGTCTYVCPTCYCFDINAEKHGHEGTEFRCWDSCMFSDYARMAGGHNPRPSKKERVRNRYLHKLAYFHEQHGQLLCVGCGRCVQKCPSNMDITRFIDMAGEAMNNG